MHGGGVGNCHCLLRVYQSAPVFWAPPLGVREYRPTLAFFLVPRETLNRRLIRSVILLGEYVVS